MTSYATHFECDECGRKYDLPKTLKEVVHICEYCFGGLEVAYDYDRIKKDLTVEAISSRKNNVWKLKELLPVETAEPALGLNTGFTPFYQANRLAKELGIQEGKLWVKDDGANYPTYSYKDRVVAIAVTKAQELGFKAIGCASTGNLADAVAAVAAKAGLESYIIVPSAIERGKIKSILAKRPKLILVDGKYDEVNRLVSEISDNYPIAFVNVNIRPFYKEGAKTLAYEIAEQLGWKAPDNIVLPVAGATLLPSVYRGFKELFELGLIPEFRTRFFAAQAEGADPVTRAIKNGKLHHEPIKASTIAKSLEIGDPAGGHKAIKIIRETNGYAESASDKEIIEAIRLYNETEGINTEPAGGVTIAATKKLVNTGRIRPGELTIIAVTGNGLKTPDIVSYNLPKPIEAKLIAFEKAYRESLEKLIS